MRYIVLSDTHGNKKGVELLLSSVLHDGVIFAGDGENDFSNIQDNLLMVKGNCDFFSNLKDMIIKDINGTKVMITHGHNFGVKSGLGGLINEAKKQKVDLVIFGHNHKQSIDKIDGITYLNPGTFKKSTSASSTYAIIDFNNENFLINIKEF